MQQNKPVVTYLKAYQPPAYWVQTVDLVFDLQEETTLVCATLTFLKNEAHSTASAPLVLNGEHLILKTLKLDGKLLSPAEYSLENDTLIIKTVPKHFSLYLETEIFPAQNTALSGLYQTKGLFCTQCEAEGFRRITYYPDRPDVMAKFSTTIQADKKRYPVLLSNGNCVESGSLSETRHFAKWEDPFKKPCYLFALVAGDLVAVEDYYVTKTGRLITLKIYVERENQDKCQHAMLALKKAMLWDEETYGREYDLDIYMIVAVNDFNMGAMENKGLNIFNAKYILARPETATDLDYQLIDAVVGHEYFHNWTGNRITCRDWFQLSLKEGLTVFREHDFSADISHSPVSLIENVRGLRAHQFVEDSGPMAHPVRPDSYIEINNFYTATVYEKGAEVIRMLQTLLGRDLFRKGMDCYFERFDGQAVTIEDLVAVMEEVSNRDLTQFRLWYKQAGTPEISVAESFNKLDQTYSLTLTQHCPPTPGQPVKQPMHIPIAIGLLDQKGKALLPQTKILELTTEKETFSFPNITVPPILSILRNFSAPVKVTHQCKDEELAFLLAYDSDSFNQWDAGQKLTERVILRLVDSYQAKRMLTMDPIWLEAYRLVLKNPHLNPALKAELLLLPSMSTLLELKKPADIDALYAARTFLKTEFSKTCRALLLETYQQYLTPGLYQYTHADVAARSCKNVCLSYLLAVKEEEAIGLCLKQWQTANNMTDTMAALSAISNVDCKERSEWLTTFFEKWQHNPLVLDKWFRIQAVSELPNTLAIVKDLMQHPAFSITNPNKVYSLIGAFSSGNIIRFHAKEGGGYRLLSDVITQLDPINPQVAARMMAPFTRFRQFDSGRQEKMRLELERIQSLPKVSKDVFEVASKSLT